VASGDQIVSSLGAWEHGILPGIQTIDEIASDVHQSHLDFLIDHRDFNPTQMDAAFINSKGFGGNNATAAILSPHVTRNMLEKKHGKKKLTLHSKANEVVQEKGRAYDEAMKAGENHMIYNFGVGVIEGEALGISEDAIQSPGHENAINLHVDNPYEDMS
jgi:acetoacetyl-[acyl-carrier protein] synthase